MAGTRALRNAARGRGAGASAARVLVADDNPVSRFALCRMLTHWDYQVIACTDGAEAWNVARRPDSPKLLLLDWMMPGMDGVEVCRRISDLAANRPPYLILVTARDSKDDIVSGLEAGANDYITKPFSADELRARLRVGERVLDLQSALEERVRDLETALAEVKTLKGLIPICMHCHKIRDDSQAWQRLEMYVESHSAAEFSHSICPECMDRFHSDDPRA
jgi:DNA-binding response OmpR family regulator